MRSRILMFSLFLVAALALLLAGDVHAQQVTTLEGMVPVADPQLAPPIPDSPPAEPQRAEAAATGQIVTASGDRLTIREQRRLGFSRLAAFMTTIRLARQGAFVSTRGLSGDELTAAREQNRDCLAAGIMGDNVEAWGDVIQDGRDWESFLAALADFLDRIWPMIEALIDRFGGFASWEPVPVPAATWA